MLIGKRRIWIQ